MITIKTIEATFNRSKILTKKTHLWKDLGEESKTKILEKISIEPNEQIIICFAKSESFTLLITTSRLLLVLNNTYVRYYFDQISRVTVNEVLGNENSKLTATHIDISLLSGKKVTIEVEQYTWPILLNILKLLSSQRT